MTPRSIRLVVLPTMALAATALADRVEPRYALVLLDDRDGVRLGSYPLEVGEQVLYRYVHSVEGAVTEEGMDLGPDGVLYLTFSRSPRHGLGHIPRAGRRGASTARPGWQESRGLRVPMTPFVLYTSTEELAGATLVWRHRSICLSRLYPDRHLEWRVERRRRVP